MSLVITIVLFGWFTSALIRSSEAKKQAKREARIREEQRRQKEELRQQREDAREWARQQVEIQREQMRLAKEQERMDAEIKKEREERIEADNKLQAQINKQNYRIEKAKSDIMFLQEDIETLTDLRHPKAMKLHELKNLKVKDDYRGIGNPARDAEIEKLTKQVRQYDKQIHAAQQKIDKANADKRDAEIKLREVA